MSEVFDDIIDRETDVAPHRRHRRIGFQACIFPNRRVRGAAVAARSEIDGRHPDESPAHGTGTGRGVLGFPRCWSILLTLRNFAWRRLSVGRNACGY
jgi:hypothetical protein